jgi:hypothetical protein
VFRTELYGRGALWQCVFAVVDGLRINDDVMTVAKNSTANQPLGEYIHVYIYIYRRAEPPPGPLFFYFRVSVVLT